MTRSERYSRKAREERRDNHEEGCSSQVSPLKHLCEWGPRKPAVCSGWCIYHALFSQCALPTMTSLTSTFWSSSKHREAMTFALSPSPFRSEVWDYGMRQVKKEKGVVRPEHSLFASWDSSRFLFSTCYLALCKWPAGTLIHRKQNLKMQGFGILFPSFSSVSHSANLENSG